jgi:RNA polymerase sigma factor (sigma-70 family)
METEAPTLAVAWRRRGGRRRQRKYGAAEFFERNYLKLLAFAMYMGALKEEAEDAIESTMIDMLDRWEMIRKPLAYARTAIAHELIKQRSRSKQLTPLPDEDIERLGGRDRDHAQEEQLTVWADTQWVRGLLNSLPPRQQEVMALVVDGFRSAEIAVLLGRDPAAVRQNLMAARRRLKAALSEQREQAGEGRA